jgi:hypothetical protein
MDKILSVFVFVFLFLNTGAQLVEVRADYNAVGDCVFSAHNNSKTPIFLNIDFADLQNTTFNETLPYIKKLTPGFNSLFILSRDVDADVPRFNYQLKSYRSNPTADVNLDFPYLIPFEQGSKVNVFDVENIDGFRGNKKLKSWMATGFKVKPGTPVYAARQGEIVEIAGFGRTDEPHFWYNTWNNAITVLQPDGTLICYKNVVDPEKKWKVNDMVYAGQVLGKVAPGETELKLLIYQNTLSSDDMIFIIPQFVIAPGKIQIVSPALDIEVVHPVEVRGLEMSKREKKKILNSK